MWLCLCCRPACCPPPLDEDCRCTNIGPWESGRTEAECGRCRGWNMIWMLTPKWGNITLEAYSMYVSMPWRYGGSLRSSFDVSERISMFIVVVPATCALISHGLAVVFPLNSACGIDNRGFICLPGCFPGQELNCVSVFCGILSNLRDLGKSMFFFFHFQSEDGASQINLWLSDWCH